MRRIFKSSVQQEIDELRKKIVDLEVKGQEEKTKWLASFKAGGWKYFQFISDYDDSGRREEYVVRREFLFHSSLDISRWQNVRFYHTRICGQSEQDRAFNKWLRSLSDEQYIEIN